MAWRIGQRKCGEASLLGVARESIRKYGNVSRPNFAVGLWYSQHGCLLHTGMNEATWQRVAQWEMLHRGECDTPTLLRFQGKPHDLRCGW